MFSEITKMFNDLLIFTRWQLSLGKKLLVVCPLITLYAIILTTVGQIFLIVSLLLPLKTILIVNRGEVPSFFPSVLQSYALDHVVWALILASFLLYALYLFFERLVKALCIDGAKLLLERSDKVSVFKNQESFATASYRKYTTLISNYVLIVFILLTLSSLQAEFTRSLLKYIFMIVFSLIMLDVLFFSKQLFLKWLTTNSSIVGVLIFFYSVLLIVYDLLYVGEFSAIIAIIAIILTRQLSSKIVSVIKNLNYLSINREKINVIYFFSHTYQPVSNDKSVKEFNDFFSQPQLDSRIRELIKKHLRLDLSKISCEWGDSNQRGITYFFVDTMDDEQSNIRFLFKIYNKANIQKFENDVLFCSNETNLVSPLLFVERLERVYIMCHDINNAVGISNENLKSMQQTFREEIMRITPNRRLVNIFIRSHSLLNQRLEKHNFSHLMLLPMEFNEKESFNYFLKNRASIFASIEKLPLQYVNNNLNVANILQYENNIALIDWSGWSIDYQGSGWLANTYSLKKLQTINKEKPYANLLVRSALLYRVDICMRRKKLAEALRLIIRLVDYSLDSTCKCNEIKVAKIK